MKNLLKWKGIMFGTDEADRTTTLVNAQTPVNSEATTTTSSEPDSSCATMIEINPIDLDCSQNMVLSDKTFCRDKNNQVGQP